MKLFGKKLFSFKREPDVLYDFSQHGLVGGYIEFQPMAMEAVATTGAKEKKRGRPRKKVLVTAKGIYALGALNDKTFAIKADKTYIDKQMKDAKRKLELFPKEKKHWRRRSAVQYGGVKFGEKELESIIERMENRKQIAKFKKVINEHPHTTSHLINDVVEEHPHLLCKKADDFVPDFPMEAVKAMEEYNKMCQSLCGKDTNYYVIASKEDFGVKDRRRDPILLAQSPFGFFWQILGAWDEEMVYLGDL